MRLEVVDTIGSTSDALQRRALVEPGEVALLARRQTGGRGRLGRQWQTIEGNLHLSVLLRPGSLRWPGHWALLAGVVAAETAAECLPAATVRLRWPNDLMLGAAKLGGVLAEAGLDATPWLVLGFGINLAGAPSGLGRATAAIAEHATAPAPEEFARALLAVLRVWRGRYAAEGFEPVRAAWLARSHAPGEAMLAASGDERVAGRFAGIAADGALLLDTAAGLVTIVAGEIA